jgi:hypothetical protein
MTVESCAIGRIGGFLEIDLKLDEPAICIDRRMLTLSALAQYAVVRTDVVVSAWGCMFDFDNRRPISLIGSKRNGV